MKLTRMITLTLVIGLTLGLPLGSFSAWANFVRSDKSAPKPPTELASTARTTTSVSLSWKASVDNFGIDRYHIYRNGIKVGEVSFGTSYTDTGLMPNTAYRYSVKSTDVGRNMSFSSRSVTVRTNPENPGSANLSVLEPRTGMIYNNFINVRAEAYNPNIARVEVFYTSENRAYAATPNAFQTAVPGRHLYFFSLNLTSQPDTTTGKIRIVARNAAGNAILTREISGLTKRNTSTNLVGLKDGHTILKNTSGAVLGTRFVVWSKHATKMQVWIYGRTNPANGRAFKVMDLIRQPTPVLGGFNWVVDALNDPSLTYGHETHYGLRVWGPNFEYNTQWRPGTEFGFKSDADKAGHRFNPNKLLNDPYSLAISHDPEMSDRKYWSGAGFRHIDTTAIAPKSVVYDPASYKGGPDNRRFIPWQDTVFYEVHVKGYTADNSSGVQNPGTYKGFAQKLDHLKDLGITSVEFLPIHESANDGRDSNGGNFWSYMTINFFAPDRKYSSDKSAIGPVHEFKDMVKAIHDNGMEVILDVVYNHTGEGGLAPNMGHTFAPMLNFRGIDNLSYYSLKPSGSDPTALDSYYDITGTTSTFNVANPKGAQFIIDSLRYWVEEMKIDGFRYDLASVLGNTIEHGNFQYSKTTLLTRILNEFPNVKHIAEPWAAGGDGSYQVGNYPGSGTNAWAEWQDRFRDTVRKLVNGVNINPTESIIQEYAKRIAGSSDLYEDDGRKPFHSISKVTAHDGFTLNDLVSYNLKQNLQDPPFGPSDGGSDNNHSWDHNGDETLRAQQIRNFALLNTLAAGTPMVLGGDEFRRTQRGNNNAYNLDTIASWYDWTLKSTHARFYNFYKGMLKLRRDNPVFKRTEFFDGKDKDNDGIPDIQWHGVSYKNPDWQAGSRTLAWRLDGSRWETRAPVDGNDFFIAANHFTDKLNFQLPPNNPGKKWFLVADTATWWSENDSSMKTLNENPGTQAITDGTWTNTWAANFQGNASYVYGVNPRSIAIFVEK